MADGGSVAGRKRMADAEMAARLKRDGVVRTSARCPMCHGVVALASLYGHVVTHQAWGSSL